MVIGVIIAGIYLRKESKKIMEMGFVIPVTIVGFREDYYSDIGDERRKHSWYLICKAISHDGRERIFHDTYHYLHRKEYRPQIGGTVSFFVDPYDYRRYIVQVDSCSSTR